MSEFNDLGVVPRTVSSRRFGTELNCCGLNELATVAVAKKT
jgi:hypothetical protein